MTLKIIEMKQTLNDESNKLFTPNEIQANIINEEDKDLLDIQSQLIFTVPYDIIKNDCMTLQMFNLPTDTTPTIEGYINFSNVNYQDYQSIINQMMISIKALIGTQTEYLITYDTQTTTHENRIQLRSNKFFKIIFKDNLLEGYYLRKVLGLNLFNNYDSTNQMYVYNSELIGSIYYLDFDEPVNFQNIFTINVMCNQLSEITLSNNAHETANQQNLTFQINTNKFMLMSESQQFTPGYKVSVNSSLHASVKSNVLINGLFLQFYDENFVEYKLKDEVVLKLNIAKAQKKIQKEADEQMYKQETEQQKQQEEQMRQQQDQQNLEYYNKAKLKCSEDYEKEILKNEELLQTNQLQTNQIKQQLEYAQQVIDRRNFDGIYRELKQKDKIQNYIDFLKDVKAQLFSTIPTIQQMNDMTNQYKQQLQKLKNQIQQSTEDFIKGKIYKDATQDEVMMFNSQLMGMKIIYNNKLEQGINAIQTHNELLRVQKDAYIKITSPENIQQNLKNIYQNYQQQEKVKEDQYEANNLDNYLTQQHVFQYNIDNNKQLDILDKDQFNDLTNYYKEQDAKGMTTEKQMEQYEIDQKALLQDQIDQNSQQINAPQSGTQNDVSQQTRLNLEQQFDNLYNQAQQQKQSELQEQNQQTLTPQINSTQIDKLNQIIDQTPQNKSDQQQIVNDNILNNQQQNDNQQQIDQQNNQPQKELLNPDAFNQQNYEEQNEEEKDEELKPEIIDSQIEQYFQMFQLQEDINDYLKQIQQGKQQNQQIEATRNKDNENELLKRTLKQAYQLMIPQNEYNETYNKLYKQVFGHEIYQENNIRNWEAFYKGRLTNKTKDQFKQLQQVKKEFNQQLYQILYDKHE